MTPLCRLAGRAPLAAAAAAPTFGWRATAGVLAILVVTTLCLVIVMRCFCAQPPRRRQDVIELVRACRATTSSGQAPEDRQPHQDDDRA